jgi:hypothetical protein
VDTEYLSNTHGSTDRPRRFEARWLQEDVVEEMVKAAWERAKARGVEISLMEKCNDVHSELHTWDRDVLKGPARKLKELKRDLEQLRRGPMNDVALAAQKEIQLQIEITLEKEEMFWVQRARANWLKHGDRNTNFFHRMASKRKKQNTIKFLMDDNGIKHEDKDSMCDVVYNYFSDLFTSEVSEPDVSVFEDVQTLVTEEMNRGLLAPFTAEEVKKALFQIGDLKAPGPDGLHSIFYKRFWEMLGDHLIKEVLEAIDNISVPEGWNNTTIVLIPKIDNPEKVTQFRPISLCNVVYKVISKMLSNRLKLYLPDIISDHQSAFVPGRLITDNILVAYESIHAMKRKKGKKGLCAVKLDMHKAYDRVEWAYLEKIMLKLGFARRWVNIVMACVSSVKYNVRFNSMETEAFTPSRGLRQGDPLSPYLFLLVAQGLSSMLKGAELRGEIDGVRVCRDAPMVSHLLFADDSLILMNADRKNALKLKDILDRYCASSGQKLSESKSSIYFSPNTIVEERAEVCQILNIMTESLNDKYLGLPAMVGIDKSECFRHLVDRVLARISGWKERLLSLGGKEILIKAIAQAIPVFAMMVFKIPKNICKGISDAISQFWWGDEEEQKHMHWKLGGNYVYQRRVEVWDLEICNVLIYLCLQNRFGGY